jgi:hypothetical protein
MLVHPPSVKQLATKSIYIYIYSEAILHLGEFYVEAAPSPSSQVYLTPTPQPPSRLTSVWTHRISQTEPAEPSLPILRTHPPELWAMTTDTEVETPLPSIAIGGTPTPSPCSAAPSWLAVSDSLFSTCCNWCWCDPPPSLPRHHLRRMGQTLDLQIERRRWATFFTCCCNGMSVSFAISFIVQLL